MKSARPLSANSRNLLSFGSRQSFTTSVTSILVPVKLWPAKDLIKLFDRGHGEQDYRTCIQKGEESEDDDPGEISAARMTFVSRTILGGFAIKNIHEVVRRKTILRCAHPDIVAEFSHRTKKFFCLGPANNPRSSIETIAPSSLSPSLMMTAHRLAAPADPASSRSRRLRSPCPWQEDTPTTRTPQKIYISAYTSWKS